MPGTRTTLDSPAFAGRLKTTYSRRSTYERRAVLSGSRLIGDITRPVIAKKSVSVKPIPAIHRAAPVPTPVRQMRSRVLKRQIVRRQPARRRKPINIKGLVLTSMAAVLFVFGIGIGVTQLHTNQKVKAQVKTLAASTEASDDGSLSSGLPSEDKPAGGVGSYKVGPLSPQLIQIPKLNVEARVLGLGVTSNNELKTPSNIYDAGWYQGSAKLGEAGAVFINGHVHGPTMPGVFFGLKGLKAGDKITVTRGDGKIFSYHVVKSQSYDKASVDMGAAFSSIEPGKPGLNLMTCDGSYDQSGEYQKRLIVFAVQD